MQFCDCGQLLLLAVDDTTVMLLSGQSIPFRRASDYVACERCLAAYPVRVIRKQTAMAGQGRPAS